MGEQKELHHVIVVYLIHSEGFEDELVAEYMRVKDPDDVILQPKNYEVIHVEPLREDGDWRIASLLTRVAWLYVADDDFSKFVTTAAMAGIAAEKKMRKQRTEEES